MKQHSHCECFDIAASSNGRQNIRFQNKIYWQCYHGGLSWPQPPLNVNNVVIPHWIQQTSCHKSLRWTIPVWGVSHSL